MQTTVGQLLVNAGLPEDLRDHNRTLDKKGVQQLLRDVIARHPDKYAAISQHLHNVGADAAYTSGASFSLEDLRSSQTKHRVVGELDKELRRIYASKAPTEQKNEQIIKLLASRIDELRKGTQDEGLAEGNNFSKAIVSGARGNAANLSSLRGADLLLLDHKDRPIPIPITRSYSEGLSPAEYFAGAYGTRRGIVALKKATADAGFLAKQIANASGRLVVTDEEPLPGTGYPVDTDDSDNEGAVLAKDYGPLRSGTVLTSGMLKQLKKDGHDEILIHSPISAGGRGVPRLAAGYRERGGFSPVGDNIGIAAAQAVSEPLSQSQLCLASGTLVWMADNSVTAIENIAPGDRVLGADRSGRTFPVTVLARHDNGKRPCVWTSFSFGGPDNGASVLCTADHKFLFPNGEVAPLPSSGECAVLSGGGELYHRTEAFLAATVQTYDLEVDHPDHLFVLANGLIVSNSAKHGAGTIGAAKETGAKGFAAIQQLVQVPKSFQYAATLASQPGRVSSVDPAPQGGHFVHVDGVKHYVHPDTDPVVKPGDAVEAGDVLSEGIPNPSEVVKYKHIGEGRRYFQQIFRKTLDDQGIRVNRRNIELLARGLINHVRVTELDGVPGALPDDILSYDELAQHYQPRHGHFTGAPNMARNKYLEKPVLHYSIGTQLTPSVVKTLQKHGVGQVTAHNDPPPFEPHMVRALETTVHDSDFFRRISGFYVGKGFMDAAQRGGKSEVHGLNWGHALAEGTDFGKQLDTKAIY